MMRNPGRPARLPVRMTSLGHAVAAVWACGTLLAGAAAARRDDAVAAFADVIDVRVVNVEVVVTDEQGRRVHGLTAADFELLVDGRPVPLDYFSEIREGRAVASPAGDVPTVPALRPNHDLRSTALDAASEAGHDGPLDQLHAARLERQLVRSVLAAAATIRGFADPPGRKAMLLLASGWPKSAANLTGYTLYPVDVPGFSPENPGDASVAFDVRDEPEAALLSDTDPTRPIGATQAGDSTFLTKRKTLQHAALERLADATGGLAMINDQRDSALAAAIADTRSYYWLGVQPRRSQDGGVHDVEARLVDRSGLGLRTREGYVDLSPEAEVLTVIDTALIFGDPPSTTPLRVRLGEPERAGRRLRVAAELAVPLDHIVFLRREGTWQAELEVWIAAMDETGNRSQASFQTFRIAGDFPPEPGQTYYIDTGPGTPQAGAQIRHCSLRSAIGSDPDFERHDRQALA